MSGARHIIHRAGDSALPRFHVGAVTEVASRYSLAVLQTREIGTLTRPMRAYHRVWDTHGMLFDAGYRRPNRNRIPSARPPSRGTRTPRKNLLGLISRQKGCTVNVKGLGTVGSRYTACRFQICIRRKH
jgi:hypothetical protein